MLQLDLFSLFGPAVCGIAAACHWWRYRGITRGGTSATATIVAVAEEEDRNSFDRVYRPEVEYRTAAGESITAPCSGYHDTRSRPDGVRVGDHVRVLYHPARPAAPILAGRYRGVYTTLAAVAALWYIAANLVEAFPSP